MVEVVRKMLTNVLNSLYQPFGFSVLIAVLFMFVYMYASEQGWKSIMARWLGLFKTDRRFRRVFILVLYTSLVLFRTLLNRIIWSNPLDDVIGVWGIYNKNGDLTTEIVENLILFIPFMILLMWNFRDRILGQSVKLLMIVWKSIKIVFLFSITIEFLQLFLRLGTFQLSDLFYNTLGGLVGGLIYWCGYKITHRNKKEK